MLKMAVDKIKLISERILHGIWSPRDELLWQVFSANSTITGRGGGLSEWPTVPPPASVPRLKHTSWYMSDHYICLQYLLFLSLNAQKPKFYSSTVVYFTLR